MELSVPEERHISRRRRPWHKLWRGAVYVFAVLGFVLCAIIGAKVAGNQAERNAYRQQMERLSAMNEPDSLPANCIQTAQLGSPEEFILASLAANLQLIDDLGLREEIRGCDIRLSVVPTTSLGIRYVTNEWAWFLKCDCEQPDQFNTVTLRVDPTTNEASVISSLGS